MNERSIDDLRIEMAWVRRLAGALVRDRPAADDLAQDAWVAALEQRPEARESRKPWLGAVVRNLSRLRARSQSRAAQRILLLPEAENPPGADELLARVQTERELVDLVCALEEPYRSVVLLRYHEGLPAARIAELRSVPAGTVRWQLKVGLDRVRAALSARHGNEHWALPLVAISRARGAGTIFQEVLVVSLKTKIALAAATVVVLLVFIFWPVRASFDSASHPNKPGHESSLAADENRPPDARLPMAVARRRDPVAVSDSGTPPQLFGPLVAMGQGFTLAEMLSKNAANADKYVDLFCETANKLRQTPRPGGEPGKNSDAAAFMAPLVDYEKPLDDPPGKLHFAEPFRDRILAYGDNWPALITDQDLAGLDFSWMHALLQFDHWSLYGAGRLRDVPPGGNIYASVIPNYTSLIYWTKLRYAASLRTGDTVQANQDLEHLSMLIRSQDLLIGVGVSLLLARTESQMRTAVAAQAGDVSGWPAPDLPSLQEDKQMEFAAIYFSYPGVSEATLRKAFGCMPSPCMSLMEGAGANKAIGSFVENDNLELIMRLSQERGCDQAPFERAFASDGLTSEQASSLIGDLDSEIPSRLTKTP